mmetsp:Transcript_11825/g.39325  ORF Transcript_11825/g.39325 Transcript_11825/m.39325 type:complete len:372 (+) Transcript_11825:1454-2569(+)
MKVIRISCEAPFGSGFESSQARREVSSTEVPLANTPLVPNASVHSATSRCAYHTLKPNDTATRAEKYFPAFTKCTLCPSSRNRRKHCRNRSQNGASAINAACRRESSSRFPTSSNITSTPSRSAVVWDTIWSIKKKSIILTRVNGADMPSKSALRKKRRVLSGGYRSSCFLQNFCVRTQVFGNGATNKPHSAINASPAVTCVLDSFEISPAPSTSPSSTLAMSANPSANAAQTAIARAPESAAPIAGNSVPRFAWKINPAFTLVSDHARTKPPYPITCVATSRGNRTAGVIRVTAAHDAREKYPLALLADFTSQDSNIREMSSASNPTAHPNTIPATKEGPSGCFPPEETTPARLSLRSSANTLLRLRRIS